MAEQLNDEVLVELQCPVCTNYMSSPIQQCATGHNLCDPCCKKLSQCALCQGKFTDARNLSLEGLALKVRYPCTNKPSGCNATLSYAERDNHELECPLRAYKCIKYKCSWVGIVKDIAEHWASKHGKILDSSFFCHAKIKTEWYHISLINAHNKFFWYKSKRIRSKFYWAVQFIGSAVEAKNYFYEIEIFKQEKPKNKILISDCCQAIDLENLELFDVGGCVSISADAISDFISFDGDLQILKYYVRVKSELEEE